MQADELISNWPTFEECSLCNDLSCRVEDLFHVPDWANPYDLSTPWCTIMGLLHLDLYCLNDPFIDYVRHIS